RPTATPPPRTRSGGGGGPDSEPDWLTERRRKGAALTSELALPSQKQKGWEFTDLTELDLDAYQPSEGRIEGLEAGVDAAHGQPALRLRAGAVGADLGVRDPAG